MKKLKKAEMVRRGQVPPTAHLLARLCSVAPALAYLSAMCCQSSVICVHMPFTLPHYLSVCQIDHVRAERDVLAEVHNPYVVKLYYSFQVRQLHLFDRCCLQIPNMCLMIALRCIFRPTSATL